MGEGKECWDRSLYLPLSLSLTIWVVGLLIPWFASRWYSLHQRGVITKLQINPRHAIKRHYFSAKKCNGKFFHLRHKWVGDFPEHKEQNILYPSTAQKWKKSGALKEEKNHFLHLANNQQAFYRAYFIEICNK